MDVIKKIIKAKNIWEILPVLTVNELEKAIQISAESYHASNISLISDKIYDILVDRLGKINPTSKVLKQVGAPIKGKKVKLTYWMGSMNKVKDEKDVKIWTKKYHDNGYLVSDKLDGISCLLTITDRKIDLFTRGNGEYGQKISHLLDLINISYEKLDTNIDIALRGELIMKKENFKKYSKHMANARNMVGGVVNSKPASVNKKYAADIDFIAYEIIEPIYKPSVQLNTLDKWGLDVVYWDIYDDITFDILDTILQKRKKKSEYEIDGIIVTDNKIHQRNKSGNPDYSIAYKGVSLGTDTTVTEIEWRPSKDGVIVPTVHFEKVKLSGADVQKATGFNAKFIVDNKIGPGAIIHVIRSGDTIPYITTVVTPAKKPALPDDMAYEWDDNKVNIILIDADDNEDVIIQRLTKFMRYIGVENLSEGIVIKLVKAGYDNIPKVMSLTVDDFLELEGFQDKLANKLYNNLQDALGKLNILTLMAASNVFGRGFGERKIKKVLNEYPNIVNEFSTKTRKIWEQKLMDVEGFDTITVTQFLDALPTFQAFYKNVLKIVDVKPYEKKVKKSGLFKGQSVCFTGFRNKDWQQFIEEEGGRVTTTVSSRTNLLIYNDGEESSSKYQTAKKLGIKTMPKSEFAKKYNL